MARENEKCVSVLVVVVCVLVTLIRISECIRVPNHWGDSKPRMKQDEEDPRFVPGLFKPSGSNQKTRIEAENADMFKALAPNNDLFGFRSEFFLPLRERLHRFKQDQFQHFTKEENADVKKEAEELIESGEEVTITNPNRVAKPTRLQQAESSEESAESGEDQDEDATNNEENAEQKKSSSEESTGFVPIRMHAQVRHSDVRKLYPYAYLEDPRLRENVIVDKGHTVYSEEGYEDLSYDHKDQEKAGEHDESYADVKHRPGIKGDHGRSRGKRATVKEHLELDPESVIKDHERGKSVENLNQKYPYYNSPKYKSSPMRYSENVRNIPKKTEGGTEFYDSRIVPCEEAELAAPDGKVRNVNNRRRKINLGDEIACFQEKYFGTNPFDSPIFTEDRIEQPASLMTKREAPEVNAVIPEVILQRAASDPQLKVYFGVMETIKAALDDYEDPEDEFLRSNKKASIFQALARRPRSKYIEADAEAPLADDDLLTQENQNIRTPSVTNLWHSKEPYTISNYNFTEVTTEAPTEPPTETPTLSKDDYNRLLETIKTLLKHQINNLTRNKSASRRNDVLSNHKVYENHRSDYKDDESIELPGVKKNIIKNEIESPLLVAKLIDTSAEKKRIVDSSKNIKDEIGEIVDATTVYVKTKPKPKDEVASNEDDSLRRRSKYTLITKNESIIRKESTEIGNDDKNRETQEHEVHNVEHHANSRIDKYPTIIKDPLKRKYYYAAV